MCIDVYAMYACISRAAKSLKEGNASAQHEVLLTNTFCMEAKERVKANIAHMTTASAALDKNRLKIAEELFDNGDYIPAHPVRTS